MYALRPYQQEAVDKTIEHLTTKNSNGIIVLPTGTGKSVVLAELCRRAISMYADTNIIVATHSKELVAQNHQKLVSMWPEGSIGIYSAGLGKKQRNKQITFAGIQSVWRHAYKFPRIDILIIDEAHTLSKKEEGTWRKFISQLETANPNLRIIGLTASPFRMTQGKIYGDDCLFAEIIYEYGLIEAVENGHLSPLHNHRTEIKYDVSRVKKRGGEFVEGDLEKAVNIDSITQRCVDEIVEVGKDRRAWIAFCSGIDHSIAFRDAIRGRGITCETVSGETPKAERDKILADYKAGKIRCVTNFGVLTTGFDYPELDLLISARPTGSPGLWLQMCGRLMRKATGKENGLVLDYADNAGRHGALDKIRVKEKISSGNGEAPKKMCPECMEIIPASSKECFACGYVFPIDRAAKINGFSSGNILLSNQIDIRKLTVKSVSYYRHIKEGKPDSLKVAYHVDEQVKPLYEWVFPELENCKRRFAVWWTRRSVQHVPNNVTEALDLQKTLNPPKFINVRRNGKYDEILNAEF